MNLLDNEKPRISKLLLFLFACFFFFLLNGYGRTSNYISSFLMVPVLLVIASSTNRMLPKKVANFIFFYLFYCVTSVTNYSSIYYLISSCIIYNLLIFVPMFAGDYLVKFDNHSKKRIFALLCLIWDFIALVSTITFFKSENGGRDFAADHTGDFLGGGYNAAFGSAILCVVLISYFFQYKSKLPNKGLMILTFVLSVAHVISTQSTITIVAMLVGVLLVFVYGRDSSKNIVKRRISTAFIVICAILFIINVSAIGSLLIKLSGQVSSELYSKRLFEVGKYLLSGDATWHMNARLVTLTNSINTFFQHPLLGIGYKYGNTYSLLAANGVGSHSELLDTFAQFGLIGGIPFILIFIYQIKELNKSSPVYVATPLFVSFALLFCFNPFLSAQSNFIIFTFLPLLFSITNISGESEP